MNATRSTRGFFFSAVAAVATAGAAAGADEVESEAAVDADAYRAVMEGAVYEPGDLLKRYDDARWLCLPILPPDPDYKDAKGIVRFGGYDPATKTVRLGDVGHFGGMKAAGGTPLPGKTPGLSMLETEKEVIWANDSLSLPKAVTADETVSIQKALQAQFPTKTVRQVPELR